MCAHVVVCSCLSMIRIGALPVVFSLGSTTLQHGLGSEPRLSTLVRPVCHNNNNIFWKYKC